MTTRSYEKFNCPIAQTLAEVGDQWTLLIVRDALRGQQRFEDFQESLGISRNLLSCRLKQMVGNGLLERVLIEGSRRHAYHPTEKCKELRKVLWALADWGENWRQDPQGPRIFMTDHDSGAKVKLEFCRQDTGEVVAGGAVRTKLRPDL